MDKNWKIFKMHELKVAFSIKADSKGINPYHSTAIPEMYDVLKRSVEII